MEKQLKTRIQHKIDTYENWEKAINFTPLKGEIIIYTTDENGYDKVGLKIGNGKDNVKDLSFVETAAAGGVGGGAATPQIQSDWLQEDSSQKDYIKNKPFYSLPAEHNFDLGLNRTFEEYIWDGDTTNRKKVFLNYNGIEAEWYKVSDNFYTRDQILNGYAYVNPCPDADMLNIMMGDTALSYLIPIPLSDSVLTNIVLYSDEHYLIGLGALSTDTPGILPLPDGNGGTIEIDIPEPGTYYLYDKTGAMFGLPGSYTQQIVGAVDVLSDPNFMIAQNIYGTGTYLAFKKVSDLFFDRNSLLDTVFTMNMISWDPSDMFNGMSVQMKVDQSAINGFTSINSSTDSSYALTIDGIPVFASFETDTGEINGMTPGKGTYLLYSDLNSANNGDVIFISNFNSGETIKTIDPKYIPKTQKLSPDWDENDPKSNLYIKNKPFYTNNIYLSDLNYPTESNVKVEIDENPNNYFGLVYSGRLPIRSNDSVNIKITSPYIYFSDGTSTYLNDITTYYYSDSAAKFTIYSLKDGQIINSDTTIAIYVPTPTFVYFYINGTYCEEFFPEAGLYYLQHSDLGFTMRNAYYLYYYWNDYNYQPNWSETDSSRPGYIRNKPNISVINYIDQYSSSPVSSSAVYNALQNIDIDVDDAITATSNNPVSSKAIYNAIQNINASEADTVDGYHFRVSYAPPADGEVDDYTITFVI